MGAKEPMKADIFNHCVCVCERERESERECASMCVMLVFAHSLAETT